MVRYRSEFRRPSSEQPTRHLALFLQSADPALHTAAIAQLFAEWDPQATLTLGQPGRSHIFVSLADAAAAATAKAALDGTEPPPLAGTGPLTLSFAERRDESNTQPLPEPPLVALRSAEAAGIPGLAAYPDFVSAAEEAELLAVADAQQHWQALAKRRVLHFGHVFDYEVRKVEDVGGW